MKRIIAFLLCLCLMIPFCSCSGKEQNNVQNDTASESLPEGFENYYGEGFVTVLKTLVSSDVYISDMVFTKSTLPVTDETINMNSKSWVKVSDIGITFKAIQDMVKTTYTNDVAEKLLAENIYAEINGSLYIDKSKIKNADVVERNCIDITVISKTDDECVFKAKVAPPNAKKRQIVTVEMKAINENGSWHLAEQYFVKK